ncbi:amidohydrolase family protein [Bacillus cereus]
MELYSKGSAWFSDDEGKKGTLAVGQFADLAVLSADYFTVPEEEIKNLESLLTIMGGQVVYGNDEFKIYHLNCRQHHLIGHRRAFMVMVVLT